MTMKSALLAAVIAAVIVKMFLTTMQGWEFGLLVVAVCIVVCDLARTQSGLEAKKTANQLEIEEQLKAVKLKQDEQQALLAKSSLAMGFIPRQRGG